MEEIRNNSRELADLADGIIQDVDDPLILQPASLDLATIKKKAGDDLVRMTTLVCSLRNKFTTSFCGIVVKV